MEKQYWDILVKFSELWLDFKIWENKMFLNFQWMVSLKEDIEEYLKN